MNTVISERTQIYAATIVICWIFFRINWCLLDKLVHQLVYQSIHTDFGWTAGNIRRLRLKMAARKTSVRCKRWKWIQDLNSGFEMFGDQKCRFLLREPRLLASSEGFFVKTVGNISNIQPFFFLTILMSSPTFSIQISKKSVWQTFPILAWKNMFHHVSTVYGASFGLIYPMVFCRYLGHLDSNNKGYRVPASNLTYYCNDCHTASGAVWSSPK